MSSLLKLEQLGYEFTLTEGGEINYRLSGEKMSDKLSVRGWLNELRENKDCAISELQTRKKLQSRVDLPFVNLHVHTDHSVFDGLSTVEEVFETASKMKQTAVGITDHGTTSALYPAARIAKATGMKLVPGVEAYLCPDISRAKDAGNAHILLLAMDEEGLHNLHSLVSLSNIQRYRKPLLTLDDLARYHSGLVATTACRGGVLSLPDPACYVSGLSSIFMRNFFIELQTGYSADQIAYNRRAVELADSMNLQVLATSDAHYATPEDLESHRKWLRLSDEKESYYNDDYSMCSLDTAIDRLSYLPEKRVVEAIRNTSLIADQCNVNLLKQGKFYPACGVENPCQRLKELCEEGWTEKKLDAMANEAQGEYRGRLDTELKILQEVGYVEYLMIVHDVVSFCRAKGIRTGPGRGSAVGSLVVYLLGITDVDPVAEGLLFERFCHPYRVSPPDIDLDVQASRREEVLAYIRKRYPHSRQIRTVNVLKDKAAIQRAGKALNIAHRYLIRLTKIISSLDEAPERSPVDDINENDYKELLSLARRFRGRVQNFGVHASAVALFPEAPEKLCAIERQGEEFLTAVDHHNVELLGVLKLDVLGLTALDTVEEVSRGVGADFNLSAIPDDDAATMKLLHSGATAGLFQLGSSGMDKMIKEAIPRCRQEIMPLIALYRPGPIESGMVDEYIRVGLEMKDLTYLHPDLESILRDTRGQIIYQEQIMKIVSVVGGFDLGEADMFRRAVAKKKPEEMATVIEEFTRRSRDRGYSAEMLEKLTGQMVKFADYAFNKSHSAAYSMLTYQMAYLKAHYPALFLCAALNSDLGDQEKASIYVAEARVLGLDIRLPAMERPTQDWQCEDAKTLVIELRAIKGVGATIVPANPGLSGNDYFESLKSGPQKIRMNILRSLVGIGFFGDATVALQQNLGIQRPQNLLQQELLGFCVVDPLLALQTEPTGFYRAVEVVSARHGITRHGDPMVFATLRGKEGMFDAVGFRSVASEVQPGQVLSVALQEGKIVNVRPI